MAVFKILDLYTYASFSIMDPKIGWLSNLTSSNLIISYKVQIYLAIGAVAISVPFGIKGIMLIFEDRLGLTEIRLPAACLQLRNICLLLSRAASCFSRPSIHSRRILCIICPRHHVIRNSLLATNSREDRKSFV